MRQLCIKTKFFISYVYLHFFTCITQQWICWIIKIILHTCIIFLFWNFFLIFRIIIICNLVFRQGHNSFCNSFCNMWYLRLKCNKNPNVCMFKTSNFSWGFYDERLESYHAKLLQQFLYHLHQIQPMHGLQIGTGEHLCNQVFGMLRQHLGQLQSNPICTLQQNS